ncbi:hypothetical protein [Sphaerisporangium sp. TRM90804]|uniref:hypothetical protein n=1 Tax=Sphaerisporangium sp. TRM90804 TaxID=3031113 RepID=UPI00244A10BF|nr:hypothetical protein [Sphaerisporangium sp. TRM90804]MDH2424812.1 hypothetical protein [Sphaerisporangium sp. TRM90804]
MNDNTLQGEAQTGTSAAGERPVCLDGEAAEWAWAQPIANNPGARIVLLSLAGMADDAWECAASQEEIAAVALVPARSVRRYMEQLEEGGHIQRHKRYDDKGHRLSDRCRLNPGETLLANLDGRQVTPVANLAGGEADPTARLDGRQVNPPANLAGRQADLWPDWPVVEGDETDTARSNPVANSADGEADQRPIWPLANLATGSDLPTGQIGRASSSPTENYEKRTSSSRPKKRTKPKLADAPPREDVEQLCARLLQWLIKKNYRQRPAAVPDGWRDEARKLLDLDGIPLAEALDVLDWSQRDGFWSLNINALPKFREKYGALEMKSRGERGGGQIHGRWHAGTDGRSGNGSGPHIDRSQPYSDDPEDVFGND